MTRTGGSPAAPGAAERAAFEARLISRSAPGVATTALFRAILFVTLYGGAALVSLLELEQSKLRFRRLIWSSYSQSPFPAPLVVALISFAAVLGLIRALWAKPRELVLVFREGRLDAVEGNCSTRIEPAAIKQVSCLGTDVQIIWGDEKWTVRLTDHAEASSLGKRIRELHGGA